MKKNSNYKSKIKKIFNDPWLLISFIASKNLLRWVPDKKYLELLYYSKIKRKLDLDNPQTYNKKLQWLKLYDRNPLYTKLVDKYEVRKYISKAIGDEYLIPLIGVWERFEDIDFDELPNQFVLKCTHDSGGIVICKDKTQFDLIVAKKKINKALKRNYYYLGREWPYKNVKPRIICEKYMVDESRTELKDYKFMCFNGEPKIIQVMSGRSNGQYYLNHFNREWDRIEIKRKNHKENTMLLEKPNELEKMIKISKELSENIPFVRIDLYTTATGVYFGEITFFPVSGYMDFEDEETDFILGSWIKLPIDGVN